VVDLNESGLVLGAGALAAALGEDVEQAFSLRNPRAVAYLEEHGAKLVTKINEETRSQMRTLVTQAVDEGWSYTRTAKAIREKFDGFAGLKPQKHIRDRATLVAVTEAGQAYEEGSRIVALGLAERGVRMEKYWRTSGDERVSQGCVDNQAAGWIDVAEMFPSGHERPLRFPGCRCTAQYRRAR
ncbi:MAG TPA: phage minor head protein, partial [Caldilineaceae bacterium]|nr:phage minor head protein [Caldilineaceae bacterium]